jgi:putative flippase GtrA
MRREREKAARFIVIGVTCATLSLAVFTSTLALGCSALAANALAWLSGAALGFVLNRRYTFEIRGAAGLTRQTVLIAGGSLAQLGISSLGCLLLLERLGLPAVIVFGLNVAATSSFMYVYMGVVFRTPPPPRLAWS